MGKKTHRRKWLARTQERAETVHGQTFDHVSSQKKWLAVFLLAVIAGLGSCAGFSQSEKSEPQPVPEDAAYKDASLPTHERVEDLLSRMTMEEKIGQMIQVDRGFLDTQEDIRHFMMGSLLSGGGSNPLENTPDGWADMYDGFQEQALSTRLGIPLLYGIDSVHGHNNLQDATIFPHNIGLGATRNPELVEQIARATALEMAGTGMRWNFAPAIAVTRDPRWGRTYEGFSENSELVGELGAAAVRGYQTGDPDSSDWVLATPKHWLGDGGTEAGKDQGDTVLPLEELLAIHGTPYQPSIAAGARVIMASYNSWNGDKVHGSHKLLTEVLRNDPAFGFEGMILSDWAAIYQLPGSRSEQTLQAINAGIDMNMIPDHYEDFFDTMLQLVKSGELSESRIDDAVRSILTIKFDMGLFEQPFADRSYQNTIRSQEHLDLAIRAVQESQVLLRNENETLPVRDDVRHIHIVGRFADNIGAQSGGWTLQWQGVRGNVIAGTSILQAITDTAPANVRISHSQAAGGEEQREADLIIAVIGEAPYAEGAGDRQELDLDGLDTRLLKAILQEDTPVAVVMLSGRPLMVTEHLPNMDALLASWLPGTEGQGIADILFGIAEPSGRLSITWPRSNNQMPIQHDDDRGRLWSNAEAAEAGFGVIDPDKTALSAEELEALPLFPYGFGLGYSYE